MSERKRYAQVGLGGRSAMYYEGILGKFAERAELVGLCDLNAGRVKLAVDSAKEKSGLDIPGYAAADFDRMVNEARPDCIIVTTKDCHHDDYICRAMELGCDVITEKPMTTSAEKCQRIIDTRKCTGKMCTVTFNYRYSPVRTQLKDILMSGVIGNILSVDFCWPLDVHHGADYFRRWHRNKANSGSLLVHKATHHFDLVNWWLSDVPVSVYATGTRSFYTPDTADRYGLKLRAERCLDCPEAKVCRFHIDMRSFEGLRKRYLENEKYDDYWRDKCVFIPENGETIDPAVDIEDSMSVAIRYAGGAVMSYSLVAYSPWEGYIITFSGTRGQLRHKMVESSYINADGSVPGEMLAKGTSIEIYPHWQEPYTHEVWKAAGGHGGADPVMMDHVFAPDTVEEDKYLRAADQRSGAYSILCGVAAQRSIMTGQTVIIDDLVQGIGMPDYPAMPTADLPLSFPVAD